jgi:hypothetical protein
MKEFKNIFLLIEKELEERKEKSIENYRLYEKMDEENRRLRRENEMLRNDLLELSKEHFKK